MGSWRRAATRSWSRRPESASRRPSWSRFLTTCTPPLAEGLAEAGIDGLWAHQADALEAARRGHTIVTTGTASGKSLAFNLPVLDTLARDLSARAFYLYPTKALAQDQARALARLGGRYLRHAIYDGDTPREERRAIRGRSNLILTNPDMLHVGVLPNHRSWGDVLANLAWVVVDEAHVYRGRVRLARGQRAAPAAPPGARLRCRAALRAHQRDDRQPHRARRAPHGLDVQLVDRDGAPRAERQIAMWNPPLVDEQLGRRASSLSEAANLLAELVEREVRTICFLRSRRGVELIQRFARAAARERRPRATWPSGSLPTEPATRRCSGARSSGASPRESCWPWWPPTPSSSGIDVGDLDAALCVTFPGTVASLRQMWGRAGRRSAGLAMYVAGEDALDQFFCRHPDEFLERPVEQAILDHESEEIHLAHLAAAAYELPLTPEDADVFGPRWEEYAQRLVQAGPPARARRSLPAARRRATRRRDRAALRLAGLGGDRRGRGRRGDRQRRDARAALHRPPGRGVPAHGRRLRGRGPRPGPAARAGAAASRATGTRSPRRSRRPTSSRCASSARPAA